MDQQMLIVTTPQQLQEAIAQAVANLLPQTAPTAKAENDVLNLDGALEYLEELGYPITKGGLYSLTHRHRIPFEKINRRRVVFSRRALREWIEANTTRPADRRAQVAEQIAKRVNNRR